ncbi:MAG: NAD-dependent epimerase/dehydratase family protein [Acidimicrobiia bacterium]
MRVLVTGHRGYIGVVLVPLFREAGHDVVGLDAGLYDECTFGDMPSALDTRVRDVRDVRAPELRGFDAIVHLAGISNDPVGDLDPECTYDINHRGTVHLAEQAKSAGVERFLFSSSCSLYGAAGDEALDERAAFNPVTAYGWSKIRAEQDLGALSDDRFSPTFLRNATAYGASARLRGDLVVNNLVGYAFTTGEVLMKSDGSPWRPLVHVEDIARAFLAVFEAPRDVVHGEAFNVGITSENYRIREVAKLVEELVPGSRVVLADKAGPDKRNYRVNCDKLATALPAYRPRWTVRSGIEELLDAFRRVPLTLDDLTGKRLQRIEHLRALLGQGRLAPGLRWAETTSVTQARSR